jgi:hypothetical protein
MRYQPSVRRVLAYVAAGLAGVAATVVVATPAFAHHTTTSGIAKCGPPGSWTVTWSADGSDEKQRYKITSATAKDGTSDATVGGPFSGELGLLPTGFQPKTYTFHGEQTFSNSVASVWLSVGAHFENNIAPLDPVDVSGTDKGNATIVQRPNCAPAPTVTFKSNCDGTIMVTLGNLQGNGPATFNVTGSPDKTVPKGQKIDVTVPGDVEITVTSAGMDATKYKWSAPTSPCPTETPTPSPTPSLPTTGSSLTPMISVGGALLVGGAGMITLLFLMRRRRTAAGS